MTRRLTGALRFFCPRDRGDAVQFGARFDVEHQDAGVQRRPNFLVALADSGEHDLFGVGPRPQTAHQLAHRHDVEARAHRTEQLQDAQIRERLHGITNQVIGAGESFVKNPEMAAQGGRAVDVNRGADPLDDLLDRHVLGKKLIVTIREMMHWTLCLACWTNGIGEASTAPASGKGRGILVAQSRREPVAKRGLRLKTNGRHCGRGTGVGSTKFSGLGGGLGTVLMISAWLEGKLS